MHMVKLIINILKNLSFLLLLLPKSVGGMMRLNVEKVEEMTGTLAGSGLNENKMKNKRINFQLFCTIFEPLGFILVVITYIS